MDFLLTMTFWDEFPLATSFWRMSFSARVLLMDHHKCTWEPEG